MTGQKHADSAESSEDESSDYVFCSSLFMEPKLRQNEVDNIEVFTRSGHMAVRAVFNPKASTSAIVESKFLESELPSSSNDHEVSGDGVAGPELRTAKLQWYFKSEAVSYTEIVLIVPDKEGTGVALGIDVIIGAYSEYYRKRLRNRDTDGGENGKRDGRIAVLTLRPQSKKEKEDQDKRKKEKDKEREEQKRQQKERDKEREREKREAENKKMEEVGKSIWRTPEHRQTGA
jgi:hypothetical protein